MLCIQRPGFPGIVLFSQYLTMVRIFQGRHHPEVAIILHAVFNVVGAQFLKIWMLTLGLGFLRNAQGWPKLALTKLSGVAQCFL